MVCSPDMQWLMPCFLQIDVESDAIVFQSLQASGAVKTASSEEQTDCLDLGGHGYSVSDTPRTSPPFTSSIIDIR